MAKVVYENIENNQFVICFKSILFHTVWAITNRFIHISPDMDVITEVKMKIDLQNMYMYITHINTFTFVFYY